MEKEDWEYLIDVINSAKILVPSTKPDISKKLCDLEEKVRQHANLQAIVVAKLEQKNGKN